MPGRGARRYWLSAVLVTLSLMTVGVTNADGGSPAPGSSGDAMEILAGSPQGFAVASAPRPFRFPDDHGAHTGFRSEWWYYTGNVATDGGRRFAFQLTFFRFALSPHGTERASAWASNQIYMAHFTVTDVDAGRFHAAERFSRGALELAGARPAPYRVWLGDWQAVAPGGFYPQRLHASDGGYAIDLSLDEHKPVVLNGDAGLSHKSAEPGNASYYYSIPRMAVGGTITTPEGDWRVQGAAWFDREWSSSALAADQVGWDWLALQLSDGRDLMVFRLRSRDADGHVHAAGTLVESDGEARSLLADDFIIEELESWRSPRDGARYPARWRLRVPGAAIDVEITPQLSDQELNLSFRYWEGAVRVSASAGAAPVTGYGHVELTGYAPDGATIPR